MKSYLVEYEYKVSESVVILARSKKEAISNVKDGSYSREDIIVDQSEPVFTGSSFTNITAEKYRGEE